MNTLFLLIANNSSLALKTLETKANVKMNIEGMEKLIFTNVHFTMNVGLKTDNERERKLTQSKGWPKKYAPSQSWGEAVPISFKLNFC